MNLKDITVDLEIAKQLKEKGFKQYSLFVFLSDMANGYNLVDSGDLSEFNDMYASPTAEELLAELEYNRFEIYAHRPKTKSSYLYYEIYVQLISESFIDNKLCNALAKMWIYLKDNNLLEVENV